MKRLAIFAEGYTEVGFVENLLVGIARENQVTIEIMRVRGGSTVPRTMRVIKATKSSGSQEYYVLIVDCGGDGLVKDRIREEHENLTKAGYTKVIGIRDVRPQFTYTDIAKLEQRLPLYIKTSLIPVEFVLSIMEIEAWFLAEVSHFIRIDPSITLASIVSALSFDPANDDLQLRPEPAEDLHNCYSLAGKTYTKAEVNRTLAALDYADIYLSVSERFPYLKRLVDSIDSFLQ